MTKRYNLIAILLIQAWLGYEFLISGWNKIAVNSSFTKGLAGYLKVTAGTRTNSYASFINHYILPHGPIFGYLIEWSEVICGVILILAAPILFVCLNKNAVMQKTAAVLSILSLAGILLMSLNFYLMAGASTVLPGANPYIPGVSFDFFIVLMSLVLIAWNATLLRTKKNQ
jgi:thiosulfate dehydrogenase [quinone] large subunit